MSSSTDLAELVEDVWRDSHNHIKGSGVFQTFFVVSKDNLNIVCAPWNDEKTKFIVCAFIRKMIKEQKADRYVLLSEAWLKKLSKEDGKMMGERTEHLIAIGASISGEMIFRRAPIVKNDKNERVLDEAKTDSGVVGDGTHEGMLGELLTDKHDEIFDQIIEALGPSLDLMAQQRKDIDNA